MNKIVQRITTPNGDTLVVMPLSEYDALLDAADVARADRVVADIAAGRDELVPSIVVDRLLEGENPIRVWREHRGLSAAVLAERASVSGGYLSELESGKKAGSVAALSRIAAALSLSIDDLI
jgi:DNA-binding XRE family transcriptional regulator